MKKTLALILIGSMSAFAVNPWVECGIGGAVATIFPNKKAGNIVAVASNIVWDLGTTATSSAVSSPDACANTSTAVAKLIQDTYDKLVAETAIGQGQNLSALLDIIGVEKNKRTAFISDLRTELSRSLSAPGYVGLTQTEKAQAYYYGFVKTVAKNS